MEVHSFVFLLLLTVTCPALLQAQSREGSLDISDCICRGRTSGEVDELKNITLTLLKEFLSFSASVKADLTAVKLNLTSLWTELGQVANTVGGMKHDLVTNKRKINAQGVMLDGFRRQLDSVQAVEADMLDQGERLFNQTSALVSQLADQHLDSMQVVERCVLDQGEQLFNQTSAVLALLSQLADRQDVLYRNLSNEVSSACSVEKDNPPTQDHTTEPPASMEVLTSTAVSPSSTTGLSASTAISLTTGSTKVTVSPTPTTVSPASIAEPVASATDSPTEEGYSCGGTSGWRRVTFLNMTDPTHQCPSGWWQKGYSAKRTCGRVSSSRGACDSATFPTGEQSYSRVCGQIVAYQFGIVSAFYDSSMDIESVYVNGLSLTHGSPRQHVWTFAGGLAESENYYLLESCPCDGGTSPVPDFVGSDYYCESAIDGPYVRGNFVFHPEDRLWDGEGCAPTSSCCEGTLPYFMKELGGSTTDDIEARICSYYSHTFSDIAIEQVELYVQ